MSRLVGRRAALKATALTLAGAALAPSALNALSLLRWTDPVAKYLETLRRADGGYAWADQQQSHLTPTFAAIGALRLLDVLPADTAPLADFVRTHHPSRIKKLEQERRMFEYQQVQALVWLQADASALRDKIEAWTEPMAYLKQYEQHGYPIFQSELGAITCRKLLGLPLDPVQQRLVPYLNVRRRENGSFNNTPATDGGDGHVMNTWWGLQALDVLGRAAEKKSETVEWLRACQLPNGGFTYQPNAAFAAVDDVTYTWAAVRGLALLGSQPRDTNACVRYLHSLWNTDGGFADRPGWLSNAMATYRALDALSALGKMAATPRERPIVKKARAEFARDLKVFTIQIEAHGHGSPVEAVDLARALRVHLWGAKNAKPEWLATAQAIADRREVPVKFFVSDEEYGTWVDVPGLGTYSHTSDIIAPAGSAFGESLAKAGVVSWPDFRKRRLAPLEKAGGRLIWQFGENEELVRLYLDDSVERGGYAAISTFHFGNPDFTNTEPFLNRWRGRIPFVALQDSHGAEPWWFSDMTTGFRTLFLGKEPTWDAWLLALKQNWVASVRRDVWTEGKTWMHAGSEDVAAFIRERESDWRWWQNPGISRPMVSLVALKPGDPFETGVPKEGVAVRVRCAWENNPQGLLKQPLSELVTLKVDGAEVHPQLMTKKAPRGALLADHYHLHHITAPGKHTAEVTARILETGATVSRKLELQS